MVTGERLRSDDKRFMRPRPPRSATLPRVQPHHERAIETLVRQVEDEGIFQAVIASFIGSTVVSRIGDLQPLVGSIAVYPEQNRAQNMRDFFKPPAVAGTALGPTFDGGL